MAPDEAPPTSSDEGKELFAWFDSLDFPDLARCPFVRVATGYAQGAKDEPLEISYFKAFLVREDAKHFTVFTSNLDQVTYTKTPPGTPKPEQVRFEPWDLAKEMTGRPQQLRKYRQELRKNLACGYDPRGGYFDKLTEFAELVVWARACAAQGHGNLARALLDEARPRARGHGPSAGKSFQQAVGDEIARARLWNAVHTFNDAEVTRKELRAKFIWLTRHFPESEPAKEARRYADLLGKMVVEDEAHARRPAKPKRAMTTPERVAELIFRLRDQHLQRWRDDDGGSSFLADLVDRLAEGEDTEKDPFTQLVDVGPEAVPQLIAALDDERFTRLVYFARHDTSHFVFRVGDAAEAILERIAGRTFWKPRRTSTTIVYDERLAEAKADIQAWWQELQQKDDERLLTERTQAGDSNSTTYAKRLMMKYPERALAAIREGARRAPQDATRRKLVDLAANLPGDAPVAFLREELQGPGFSARVAAARALLDRGRDEGVAAMIREWERNGPGSEEVGARNTRDRELNEDGRGRDEQRRVERNWAEMNLIRFLLRCGRVEAVRALADGWKKRPAAVCGWIIDDVERAGCEAKEDGKRLPAPVEQAFDELLVPALDDTRECTGLFRMREEKSLADPRLADLSGDVLARRWKEPAAFDLFGTLKTRDRQRGELKNLWLKKQGKPPVALPVRKSIERLPDEQVLPLLSRLESARSPEEHRQARASVLALGLPGLPAVRARLHNLKQGQPAFAALEEVAVQMALIVEETRFAEHSAPPTPEIKQRLESWKGKPMTGGRVVDLVQAVASEHPAGVNGIQVAIDREGDDTGVTVIVTLASAARGLNGTGGGWDSSESVLVDGQMIHSNCRGCAYQAGITADHWRAFRKYLRSALQAPPQSSLSARVAIIKGE